MSQPLFNQESDLQANQPGDRNSGEIRALAIETSGRVGSVALALNGVVVGEEVFPHGLQHAARIIPTIDQLCKSIKWKQGVFDEIYVSAGPGSFTGMRIGITLAKTLAFATGAKLVAVPSVRVLVENAPADAKHVILVLDAKRDQIFTAAFDRAEGGWKERVAAHLGTLNEMISISPRPVHLLGEGIPYHRKFIDPTDSSIHIVEEQLWRGKASTVARLGWKLARAGEFADPFRLTPTYIRRPEAEEKADLKEIKRA